MPRFWCDYCAVHLTHDSYKGRKQHMYGWKHRENVKQYYNQFVGENQPGFVAMMPPPGMFGRGPPGMMPPPGMFGRGPPGMPRGMPRGCPPIGGPGMFRGPQQQQQNGGNNK